MTGKHLNSGLDRKNNEATLSIASDKARKQVVKRTV
jgi:hypothetical protein